MAEVVRRNSRPPQSWEEARDATNKFHEKCWQEHIDAEALRSHNNALIDRVRRAEGKVGGLERSLATITGERDALRVEAERYRDREIKLLDKLDEKSAQIAYLEGMIELGSDHFAKAKAGLNAADERRPRGHTAAESESMPERELPSASEIARRHPYSHQALGDQHEAIREDISGIEADVRGVDKT